MTTPSPEATRAAERITSKLPLSVVLNRRDAVVSSFATLIDAEYAALRERVERLSRIEAAAVRWQRAENATELYQTADRDSVCQEKREAETALFATLPSSEAVPHA
jgi:hypothetical protein